MCFQGEKLNLFLYRNILMLYIYWLFIKLMSSRVANLFFGTIKLETQQGVIKSYKPGLWELFLSYGL